MIAAGLYCAAALALLVAVVLIVNIGETAWESRRSRWTCGQLAGFATCCAMPLALVACAYLLVSMAGGR